MHTESNTFAVSHVHQALRETWWSSHLHLPKFTRAASQLDSGPAKSPDPPGMHNIGQTKVEVTRSCHMQLNGWNVRSGHISLHLTSKYDQLLPIQVNENWWSEVTGPLKDKGETRPLPGWIFLIQCGPPRPSAPQNHNLDGIEGKDLHHMCMYMRIYMWLVVKVLVPEFSHITPFPMGPASQVSCGLTIHSF